MGASPHAQRACRGAVRARDGRSVRSAAAGPARGGRAHPVERAARAGRGGGRRRTPVAGRPAWRRLPARGVRRPRVARARRRHRAPRGGRRHPGARERPHDGRHGPLPAREPGGGGVGVAARPRGRGAQRRRRERRVGVDEPRVAVRARGPHRRRRGPARAEPRLPRARAVPETELNTRFLLVQVLAAQGAAPARVLDAAAPLGQWADQIGDAHRSRLADAIAGPVAELPERRAEFDWLLGRF